ncbi:MAG: RidA family protein [Sphingomicrobium sp.]
MVGETRLPFSEAVRVGDTLYLSGQIGIGAEGKLPAGIDAQTKQAMDNIGGVLKARGLGFGDVVKCTVMLDNMADWPAFNKVYVTYFPDGKFPARSAFGADGLALGALLEIECMAYAGKK